MSERRADPGADAFPAPVYRDTVLAPLFDASKRHFAGAMMAIHRAHAVMLVERGILDRPRGRAILEALGAIDAEVDPAALHYTGEHEDYFFHVEHLLAERLGVDTAGRLHTGRSRNDMDHTIFKLVLQQRLDGLMTALEALLDTLLGRAHEHRATLMLAYTHAQPAQPTTFGHYLGAFIEVALRDADRLLQAAANLERCSMGAAAITTTGFPIDRERVAELLGFASVQENSYGCIAACDYVTGLYAQLKVAMINVGRVCQDLQQATAFEVGHLRVPDAYVQVSSIMPQKRNPVPIEHLRLMCSLAAGQCDAVMTAMHNTPFTDMNDSEAEVQIAGYEAFDRAGRALALLRGLMRKITVDEVRVRRHIAESSVAITELADSLVRSEDISFREARGIAARLAREVARSGTTLDALDFEVLRAAFRDAIGREPALAPDDFGRLISPEHFVAVRERTGGPGPRAMAASLARYGEQLAALGAALEAKRERRRRAAGLLDAAVGRIVGAD